MIRCDVCGSTEWTACAPGTEAATSQGNLFVLIPEADVPTRAWCAEHDPRTTKEKAA